MQKKYRVKKGVSILIGLGMVAVLVFFGLLVSNVVTSSIRQSANVNNANKAYYAAEGALEMGLLANVEQTTGYTAPALPVGFNECSPNDPACSLKASYVIQGQVDSNAKIGGNYIIPSPGYGNAGKVCDPLKAVTSGIFSYTFKDGSNDPTTTTANAIENPCNWNRLYEGQTVTIPLYVTTTDPTKGCHPDAGSSEVFICNPADSAFNLNSVIVKIRTACKYGNEMCLPMYRYTLDDANGSSNVAGDDTIIDWQITGQSQDGSKSYVLVPSRKYDDSILLCEDANGDYGRCMADGNSEIYEGLINAKRTLDFKVLDISNSATPPIPKGFDLANNNASGPLFAFIKNLAPWNIGGTLRPTVDYKIFKPVLKLTVIRSITDKDTTNRVPYLEYQIVTDGTTSIPPTDVAQKITAEGFSGEFKQALEVKIPQSSGILEYVVQQ